MKPKWLIDRERQVKRITVDPDLCGDCANRGLHVKFTKYKGSEWTEMFECSAHPKCFNTKYSLCCEDFVRK